MSLMSHTLNMLSLFKKSCRLSINENKLACSSYCTHAFYVTVYPHFHRTRQEALLPVLSLTPCVVHVVGTVSWLPPPPPKKTFRT
jgi:hypothetical protein